MAIQTAYDRMVKNNSHLSDSHKNSEHILFSAEEKSSLDTHIRTVHPGSEDGVKEIKKQAQVNQRKLNDLVEQSKNVLYVCKAVFPFDFFPDEITIDIHTVNVYKKQFLKSGSVHSLYIPNIAEIYVERNLFFGKIRIIDRNFTDNILEVRYLTRKDATNVRKIVQGLIQAYNSGIDLTHIPQEEILPKIYELGTITAMKSNR